MKTIGPYSPVLDINGVGKVTAEKFDKIGINTVMDLLYHFPRAYENRGSVIRLCDMTVDTVCSFILTVATEVNSIKVKSGITISKFRAYDNTGSIEIVFYNSPYIKEIFHTGSMFRFYGKPTYSKKFLQMANPKYEPYVEGIPLPNLVPIYPSIQGVSSKQIEKMISSVMDDILPQLIDPLPDNLRVEKELAALSTAIKNAHFPTDSASLTKALMRLAFDEMMYFGIGISLSASTKRYGNGAKFSRVSLEPLLSLLPYELTNSQKMAVNDIYKDTVIGTNGTVAPMTRIVVGDVGCGKTICAIIAMYIAAKSGYQSALMVPTEILARQHYADVVDLLGKLGIKSELLLGSTKKKDKTRIYASLEDGSTDVVIGTHALLSDKFSFASLGLVITDEQHRFGVSQRARLKEKADASHMLVMSATPIPRTLALAMYGDLDVSRITDMPKGREPVDTFVVNESYRARLHDFIKKQVQLGGQCYIVCPSIEADEDEDAILATDFNTLVSAKSLNLKSAVEYCDELRRALPDLRINVLHGKMKPAEKDEVMNSFVSGETNVLVSTTVIEVGVNVPNASLMVVENAERFGLSQLHQLRGRIGRGSRKSYCVLVSDASADKSRERLEIMRTTFDGYEIAERDLMMRGPGDFFSINSSTNMRQSGGFEFKFASMCDSTEMLESAFSTAKRIVEEDRELALPQHREIKNNVMMRLTVNASTIS